MLIRRIAGNGGLSIQRFAVLLFRRDFLLCPGLLLGRLLFRQPQTNNVEKYS